MQFRVLSFEFRVLSFENNPILFTVNYFPQGMYINRKNKYTKSIPRRG